jgi:hypothetical protein
MLRWKSSLKATAEAPPSGGSGSPTFVKSHDVYNVASNVSSIVLTLSSGVPAGSVLVVLSRGGDISSIADNSGNTWAEVIEDTDSGTTQRIWWAPITTALSNGDEVTLTIPSGYAGRYAEVAEISNANALDDSSTAKSFTTQGTVSLTTSADAVAVGVASRSSGSGGTISGFNSTLLTFTTGDIQTYYSDLSGAQAIDVGISVVSNTTIKRTAAAFKYVAAPSLNENFDDVSLPAGWTFTGNSYTLASSSLKGINGSDYVEFDLPTDMQDEFWVEALVAADGSFSKAGYMNFFHVMDSSSNTLAAPQFYGGSTGTYRIDGVTDVLSLANVIEDSFVRLWFHYVRGGTSEMFVSDSPTRPTVDSVSECVVSTSTSSTTPSKIRLRLGWSNGTRPLEWAYFKADTADPSTWPATTVAVPSKLEVHYDASSFNVSDSSLADLSGNGRDATLGGGTPSVVSAGLNGVDTIDSNNGGYWDMGTGLDWIGSSAHTCFAVIKRQNNAPLYGAVNGSQGANSPHVGWRANPSYNQYVINYWGHDYQPSASSGTPTNSWGSIRWIWWPGNKKQVNDNGGFRGNTSSSLQPGTPSGGGRLLSVTGQTILDCEIAAVLWYSGELSEAEIAEIADYIDRKFGTTSI